RDGGGTKASTTSPLTPGLAVPDSTTAGRGVGGGLECWGNITRTTSSTQGAAIHAAKTAATAGLTGFDLAFNTRVNSGNVTEKMRITTGGNVGIGTTNPLTLLETSGAIHAHDAGQAPDNGYNGLIRVTRTPASGQYINLTRNGNFVWSLGTVYNSNTFAIGAGQATDSAFTAPAFNITTGGNVGIGTTAPASTLDVNGAIYQRPAAAANTSKYMSTNAGNIADLTNLNPGLLVFGTGNFYGLDLGYNSSSSRFRTRIFSPTGTDIAFASHPSGTAPTGQASFTDLVVINSTNGNVGIGSVTPGAKLQVNGQAASVVATIASTTVDFNSGNIQTNSVAAGTLTLSNMIDGASYTLILTNATGGNYVLSGSSITAWHCAPACASNTVTVVGGTHTVLSLMKVGVNGYVTWINGM
ncbi:MAG: hypothetical protein NTY08_09855, partial [Proteobacteria bacterium]|nr:hypothetical protein [Pseudomonadota bacterium]